jgi:hypothetical protein
MLYGTCAARRVEPVAKIHIRAFRVATGVSLRPSSPGRNLLALAGVRPREYRSATAPRPSSKFRDIY